MLIKLIVTDRQIGRYFDMEEKEVNIDDRFMREALREAEKAFDADEVPVGVVVVHKGRVVARAHNLTERLNDPTAHAEMQAITMVTGSFGGKYLDGCTLYVTLEPCAMCAAALNWAQLKRVVYGAFDEKRGFSKYSPTLLHPKTEVSGGILEKECVELIKHFFKEKREE
jgi:Cytosine/adenosine deaminases